MVWSNWKNYGNIFVKMQILKEVEWVIEVDELLSLKSTAKLKEINQ